MIKSLLFLALIAFTLAHEHVETEFNPDFVDYDEQIIKPEGRSLATYPNIRIGTDFQLFTVGNDDWKAYIINQLVPAAVDYLQGALKIKYPLTSPITSSAKTLCGFTTPDVLKTGVNADIMIFLNSKNGTGYSWIAATTLCTISTGVKRPVIVNIGINTAAMKIANPDTNPLTHDLNLNVLIHEFIHALGMNGPLYNYFLDADGNLLQNHVKTIALSGVNQTVLDLPPLTERLRNFYGCPTIPGLFMETDAGAHIERRFYQWEIMSTGGIIGSKISEVTLGFLEGTGWYVPDYCYAEPYFFGKGQGCAFFADDISGFQFSEYCTGNGIGCTEVNNGGGYCVSDSLIAVGKVYTAQYEFNCENPNGIYYTPFSSKQVYGRGKGSRCFSGNLTTSSSASVATASYCLNATCQGTGLNTTIQMMWGTTAITCKAAGPITISGYKGILNCPDPVDFCETVGKPTCPRNCMGRGTCSNGQCICDSGYIGTDCGFIADVTAISS